jgi:carboxypeptidase C (cathepsin A)
MTRTGQKVRKQFLEKKYSTEKTNITGQRDHCVTLKDLCVSLKETHLCVSLKHLCVSRARSRVGKKGDNVVTRYNRPNAIEKRDLYKHI